MKFFCFVLKSLLFTSFTLLGSKVCQAQNYGLGFSSHEAHQDKRTSLNLSVENEFYFSENFEISFDLSFSANHNVYFGYVVRIIDEDRRNYDIVYNTSGDRFNLVIGDKLSKVSFAIPPDKLYNQWNKIRLKFDVSRSEITVFINGTAHIQQGVPIKKCNYKIVFGANRQEPFETTDVPPMKIREVKLFEKQSLKYYWPLNNVRGAVTYDLLKKKRAEVTNPNWQTARHTDWQNTAALTVNGMASIAFDAKKELVYVVAPDSIYTYAVAASKWSKSGIREKINLNQGNRSFLNPTNNRLYNYFPGSDTVLVYDPAGAQWSGNFRSGEVTAYWHFNKMFSEKENSLYVFGGYGYLLYKNTVQKYDFASGTWSEVKYEGDFFTPRYLAGLGTTAKGDTAYILGGYGNNSGQQILNPKNLYDMMRYTVNDKKFTKLFDLNVSRTDFALANSLVIDERNGWYYGLIFDRNKYSSSLQLLRGSLKSPSFEVLESEIPYAFHDVHSFADLYYCRKSRRFLAITLLRNEDNTTNVKLFTLSDPPYFGAKQVLESATDKSWYYLIMVTGVTMLAGMIYYLFNKSRSRKARLKTTDEEPARLDKIADPNPEVVLASQHQVESGRVQYLKNSILLFGDLQVFDSEGNSITKLFTPLIKELFLIILLHSVKLGRGVSSDKLNELFWYDKSEKSARNNRSVAIVKLRSLLEKMDHCKLSKDSGYWMIEIDYQHIYVDYHSYLTIIKNRKEIDKLQIQHLSGIIQRGNFLSASEYEWLDNFKSEISNDIINTYLHFLQMPEHENNPETIIEIANYILNIDAVNEEAMALKCKSFVALGKHSLAKITFDTFVKAYRNMYDHPFERDFNSILE